MADAYIQLVDDSANTGKKTDTSPVTVSAQTVQRQRINLADPTTAAGIASVAAFLADNQAIAALYGLLVGNVPLVGNVNGKADYARGMQGDGVPGTGIPLGLPMLAQPQVPITATSTPTAGANKTITMASTAGIKVGSVVLVAAGGASEYARVNTVVLNTSITVDNLVAGYTTPTITPILFDMARDCAGVGQAGTLQVGCVAPGVPVADSHTAAAGAVTCTLPAAAGKTTYLTGFTVTGLGATAAGSVQITTTGLVNNLTYTLPIPAGVTSGVVPLNVLFGSPIPASGPNVAIVVTVPSFGTGNTVASATATGFQI